MICYSQRLRHKNLQNPKQIKLKTALLFAQKGYRGSLNFIIAEFIDDLRRWLLVAASKLPPQRCTSLGSTASCRVARPKAGRPRGPAFIIRQHAVLGVGLRPVHALLDVILHAQPLLEADSDAALFPLVVQGTLGWITQGLLCFLKFKTKFIFRT